MRIVINVRRGSFRSFSTQKAAAGRVAWMRFRSRGVREKRAVSEAEKKAEENIKQTRVRML